MKVEPKEAGWKGRKSEGAERGIMESRQKKNRGAEETNEVDGISDPGIEERKLELSGGRSFEKGRNGADEG